jgi:hypothetical protein
MRRQSWPKRGLVPTWDTRPVSISPTCRCRRPVPIFDAEWGFLGQFHGTTGDWREYRFDDVIDLIHRSASASLDEAAEVSDAAHETWSNARPEIVSILSAYLAQLGDALIEQLRKEAEETRGLHHGGGGARPRSADGTQDGPGTLQAPRARPAARQFAGSPDRSKSSASKRLSHPDCRAAAPRQPSGSTRARPYQHSTSWRSMSTSAFAAARLLTDPAASTLRLQDDRDAANEWRHPTSGQPSSE